MCLVELVTSILVGPHLPIDLRGYLQPCHYVWDSDYLLELYKKIMFRGRVPSRVRPHLELFVGFSRALLLCGHLVHPHGLRSTWRLRSDKINETAFLCDSFICSDVRQSPTPDLGERLRVEPQQRFTKRSWQHSFDEGVYRHGLICGFQPYHLDPKPVQVLRQRLPLVLFNVKDIVRESSGGPVDEVLFSEQRHELVERGDVSVREADKPFQRRVCQRAHKQLAIHSVRPSYEHHLGMERCEMGLWVLDTCEDDLQA